MGHPDNQLAPLGRHKRTHRSHEQPNQTHQTNRLRIPQLRQLPNQSPPLRRKTQLEPTNHHHSPLISDDPEKSQIQALERSQRSLPLKPGRAGTLTHDYRRHGTTTLFAALDTATGRIIADCRPRHRHQEFLAFLKLIERHVPQDLDVHLVIDNYAAHKHANVTRWLEHLHRRERWHIHYTPTSASWLNLVERWFRELTQKRLRRDSFRQLHSTKTASLFPAITYTQRISAIRNGEMVFVCP